MALKHAQPVPYKWIYREDAKNSIGGLVLYALGVCTLVMVPCFVAMGESMKNDPDLTGIGLCLSFITFLLAVTFFLKGRALRTTAKLNAISTTTGSVKQAWESCSRFDKTLGVHPIEPLW